MILQTVKRTEQIQLESGIAGSIKRFIISRVEQYIVIIGKPVRRIEARITDITRKAIPKAFLKENADEIEGIGLCPVRCTLGGTA